MYKVNKRLKKAEAKRSENVLNPKILVEMAISQTPKGGFELYTSLCPKNVTTKGCEEFDISNAFIP